MGQGGFRLLFAVAAAVGLMALALTGTAGAAQSCGTRVLDDWRDGRIDGTYPVACYRQALAHLPEDVRVYSTAQSDITRALQARLGIAAAQAGRSNGGTGGVSPLLVVAITAAILVAAGSVAAAVR
jgi:hypothetical protein